MSVPKIPHFLLAIYYTKTQKFSLEFSKKFDIHFLKSMSENMGIHTDFQKNIFWSICISAQISFLRFYVISGTDKSFFWVVQFFTENSLPKELCNQFSPFTWLLSNLSGSSCFNEIFSLQHPSPHILNKITDKMQMRLFVFMFY